MDITLADLAQLTQQNREVLKRLYSEFAQLRELVASGISISALPELPAPIIELPPYPEMQTHEPIDVAELAAVIGPILAQSSSITTERLDALAAMLEKFATEVKQVGSNAPQKVLGGQAGKIKDSSGNVVNPATNEKLDELIAVQGGGDSPQPTVPLISADGDGAGSGGNSGTATLATSATWVGAWEDVSGYAAITIVGKATQSSATNGAVAQFSSDGVNVLKETKVTIIGTAVGGQAVAFSLFPEAKYFRIHYTNGGTASSDIELQTVYRKVPNTVGTLPIGSTVTAWNLAQLVRAVLSARRDDGTYDSVGMTNSNNLQVAISEATAEVPIDSLSQVSFNQQTVGTTAVQVPTSLGASLRSLSLKSLSANTASIYIGTSSAVTASNGWPLDAGDSIDLEIDNTTNIYAIAGAAGQRIAWAEAGVS